MFRMTLEYVFSILSLLHKILTLMRLSMVSRIWKCGEKRSQFICSHSSTPVCSRLS
jgi:hypothetical protein